MQASTSEKESEEKSSVDRTVPAREMTARISMRTVSALEIASVFVSVIIISWAIIPLQPWPLQPLGRWAPAAPAFLALALMINSQWTRGESPREVGLGGENFFRALRLLTAPTLIACAGFAAIGYSTGSFHRAPHFWKTALGTLVWALIQQYVSQAFIYRRVRFLLLDDSPAPPAIEDRKSRTWLAILLNAAIFSLVHAPNPSLMILTFFGGLMWSWVYDRAPNLPAIAISHAAISLTLMTSLPPWLLPSMRVGYKYFLYQRF